jgi:ribosomal-protein-alanine N-acetyltransferase
MIDLQQINIRKFHGILERDTAARLLMDTDPWKSFGRTYENCLEAVTNPQKEAYGAFIENDFLGLLVVDLTGPLKGYIQAVCVVDEVRGKGVGSLLMKFAEGLIFEVSPNCFLCYSDFNDSVGSLYKHLGYEVVGTLNNYMIPGHAEYLMRKTIGPIMPYQNRQKQE